MEITKKKAKDQKSTKKNKRLKKRIGERQIYHYVNVNMYDILLFKERVSVRENARERKKERLIKQRILVKNYYTDDYELPRR